MENLKIIPSRIQKPNPYQNWQVGSDYEILRKSPLGNFSQAAVALQKSTNQEVIIEKIPNLFTEMSKTSKILRDLILYRNLKHPYLLKVIEIIQPDDLQNFDTIYVVFEYCQADMRNLFRNPMHLDNFQIQQLVYNTLVALKYMHSCGLIHRNLTPQNILINEDYSVRICGFKSTKSLKEIKEPVPASDPQVQPILPDIKKKKLIKGGLIKRELNGRYRMPNVYRALDIFSLRNSHDSAVDIWSVGCIFGELLCMKKGNAPTFLDRCPVFPYPFDLNLSDKKRKFKRLGQKMPIEEYKERFQNVFMMIGSPKEEDLEFITNKTTLKFLESFPFRKAIDWFEIYPDSSAEELDLLQRMLEFNPKKRITLDECFYHPFLADIKDKIGENVDLSMGIDIDKKTPMARMREAYIEEIMHYKKN